MAAGIAAPVATALRVVRDRPGRAALALAREGRLGRVRRGRADLMLIVLSGLIVLTSGSAVAPFIYTLF